MRYPLYLFLLMSCFFYLTGNPFDDTSKSTSTADVQGKVYVLKYARRTSPKVVPAPAPEHQVKIVEVAGEPTGAKNVEAMAHEVTDISEEQWEAVALEQEPKRALKMPVSPVSLEEPTDKRIKTAAVKKMDWNVFSNERQKVSLIMPVRTGSKRVSKKSRIPERVRRMASRTSGKLVLKKLRKAKKVRKYAKSKRLKKVVKKRQIARKSRKARSTRKSKSKRYARLKRKNKGLYRVARRVKKKSVKKRNKRRSRRKTFGFSVIGGGSRLGSY